MPDYTAQLNVARQHMAELVVHTRAFQSTRFSFVPPILDKATDLTWGSFLPPGIVGFMAAIENQAAALDKVGGTVGLELTDQMAASDVPLAEDPLPPVLGLVTIWKQVVLARAPVTFVRSAFKGAGGKKARETFVDVIARGGAEWIRLYNRKASALLAEFRLEDSYLTEDEDEDAGPPPPISNTVTRLVDDLLAAVAEAERPPGAARPTITLRITRIEEHPAGGHPDPRIPATFAAVRARGVKLVFGDLSEFSLSSLPTTVPPPPVVRPTRRLNLDPTALMGLCSDLVHYPLPKDEDEAAARYFRPEHALESHVQGKDSRCFIPNDRLEWRAQSKNSVELVHGLIDEMGAPVIEQIRDALDALVTVDQAIEFWATRNAIKYVQETISSETMIGEGGEQRRMRCLTGLQDGDFWEGSRYEGKAGVLTGIKLHVFGEPETYPADYDSSEGRPPLCREGMTSFHTSTAAIATQLVAEYHARVSGRIAAPSTSMVVQKRLPAPRVVHISVPLPVVSLESLAHGSAEGMTTLLLGHVVFRDLFNQPRWRINGWAQSNYETEDDDKQRRESEKVNANGNGEANGNGNDHTSQVLDPAAATGPVNAVAWILPYRLLGEGKRIKFAKGDYSFPNFINRGPAAMRAAREAASGTQSPASPASSRPVSPVPT